MLQSLERIGKGTKTERIHEIDRLGRREVERLRRSRRGWTGLVSCHGDTAADCVLDLALYETCSAAVGVGLESEAFDRGAGVCDGKGAGARGGANGEVGGRLGHDSADAFASDAGLVDAEVRVGDAVVNADRIESGGGWAGQIIKLEMSLAGWTLVGSDGEETHGGIKRTIDCADGRK